jgi:1-acyl-sn-glycerol-3-phosphate acyltransferase
VHVDGLEHVPDEGPCVIVCNHVSYVDAVAIAACVRRPVRFVMDHRIFATPGLGWLFRTMGAIPIAPGREDASLKRRALEEAAAVLARGEVLGIFPEGRLTPDGELGEFRPGLVDILERTPAPVVPMALQGLWGSFFSRAAGGRAMRRLRGIFSRIALVAGAPIAPRDATPARLQAAVAALRGDRR